MKDKAEGNNDTLLWALGLAGLAVAGTLVVTTALNDQRAASAAETTALRQEVLRLSSQQMSAGQQQPASTKKSGVGGLFGEVLNAVGGAPGVVQLVQSFTKK